MPPTSPVPPLKPEPLEAMQLRFPAAIAELLTRASDKAVMDAKHAFDFDDGLRLMISRDLICGKFEMISCIGGLVDGSPMPCDLLICKIAIHFAMLTGGKYSHPVSTHYDRCRVWLLYEPTPGALSECLNK